MKDSINLVSKKKIPNAFHKRFFVGAVIFFSIVFLISAGLIGYTLILSSKLSEVKSEETNLIVEVNQDPEKKVQFLTVRERLSEIQKVINKRKNINTKIDTVSEFLPFDVSLNLVEGDDETISLRVAASDLSSLDSLIEEKINEYVVKQGKGVKRVEMTTFNLNRDTLQYEANFTIEFK